MRLRKIMILFLVCFLAVPYGLQAQAASVSQGVYHTSESVTVNGYRQSINSLSINLDKPFTTIDVGLSNPIYKRYTVSSLAKSHTQINHHVVGAINASFFHMTSGYPSYLLIKDNIIQHLGSVSSQYNDFMYTPAAFGVTADNTAKIGEYKLGIQIGHGGKLFNLTALNRERGENESILFTSSWSYERTRTNSTGLEVVVETTKSIEQQVALGETVTGTVSGIRPYGQATSASIPANGKGFVISATGAEVDKIRNIKKGDPVSISFDLDANWKNSKFLLASGPILVKNGKVSMSIDPNSPKARERTARTAVATDSTGRKAFFVTADSGVSGVSSGMTLKEFADYLVKTGVHNAINLDGGGSTTMVTRKYGDVYPTLANRPSAGSERAVSAILEAVSTAPYGDPTFIKASQSEDGLVAVGASVGFKVTSVLDQYYNVLQIDPSKLVLESVSNNVGAIENNQFVGKNPGNGIVHATYQNTPIEIPVTVTDRIDDLVFSVPELRTGTNGQADVSVKGIINNNKVIFNQNAVQVEVTPSIGTWNGKTFTAGSQEATGTLTAQYGNLKKSIPVIISDKPVPLGSFESLNGLEATSVRAQATIRTETAIQPFDGNASLRLNYDFTNQEGVSAAYVTWKNGFTLSGKPRNLGIWVYGDGRNHWLRGTLTDAANKETTIDFTSEGGLNWTGWKYVEASIPQTIESPIKLNRIYVAETSASKKDKGYVLFDKIQASYTDKVHNELAFTPSSTAMKVDAQKEFTVKFTQPMKSDFLNSKYVYVEDMYGNRQSVTVTKTADPKIAKIAAPAGGYEKGKNYRLVVTHFVQNDRNVSMVKDSVTEFRVD